MTLKEKILSEMVVDFANQLEKNYEHAKKFIRLTQTGTIDIIEKQNYQLVDQVQLYLLGKLYSHHSGLSESAGSTNSELENELGTIGNSLRPVIKKLRDKRIIKTEGHEHYLQVNFIDKVLNHFEKSNKK